MQELSNYLVPAKKIMWILKNNFVLLTDELEPHSAIYNFELV